MGWFKRRPDSVAKEILEEIAMWASDRTWDQKTLWVLDSMLFNAATIVYRDQTESMGTDAAVEFLKARVKELTDEWDKARNGLG